MPLPIRHLSSLGPITRSVPSSLSHSSHLSSVCHSCLGDLPAFLFRRPSSEHEISYPGCTLINQNHVLNERASRPCGRCRYSKEPGRVSLPRRASNKSPALSSISSSPQIATRSADNLQRVRTSTRALRARLFLCCLQPSSCFEASLPAMFGPRPCRHPTSSSIVAKSLPGAKAGAASSAWQRG